MSQTAVAETGDFNDAAMESRVLAQLGLGEVPQKKEAPVKQEPVKQEPVQQEQQEPVDQSDPVDAQAETQPEDNLIEVDFRGAKYKLPQELKELHEGYLRQEDYTRKTQEVAERQRVIELVEQQAQAQRALQSVTQPYVEALMGINNQLSQYSKVDWATYSDQDPTAANKHWIAYQSLKDRKASLEQEMNGAATQHLQKLKDVAEGLRKENSKILSEKVKGWNSDVEAKVRDHVAKNYGFSKTELDQVFDARLMRLMNSARQWDELQASKPAITKQAAPASKTLKPGAAASQNQAQIKAAELKRGIRSAKTDESKARAIEAYLMNKM